MGIRKIGHQNLSCNKISYSCNGEGKEMDDNLALGVDSGDDSDNCEHVELDCELAMVEGQLSSIPYDLYDLPDLRQILSVETWNSCLTEEERFYLSAYLPDMDQQTFWLTMKEVFDGSNIYFGNPMDMFFKRLKGGLYPPRVNSLREGLQFLQRKKYYHSLRGYHDRLAETFIDMRRMWEQCEVGSGVEERISMWTKRRKQKGINLLDLNKFPKDDHMLSEEFDLDITGMKSVEIKRAKDMSAIGRNFVAPNCRAKGVLKMKASGNSSFQNNNPKIVTSDILEQRRSMPKGVLKMVPKVPFVQLRQSEVVPRGAEPAVLVRSQGLQDFKFSSLPASLYFRDVGGLYESPYLRQKFDGSQVYSTLDQPQCLLNRQESNTRASNHSESSTVKIKKEMGPSLDDISVLGRRKLFGGDVGRGKEYGSSMDPIGGRRSTLVGKNLCSNSGVGTTDFSLRSLESYPFDIQYHVGAKHEALMKEERFACHPRNPESVVRISDVGKGKQKTLIESSSGQMKSENDVCIMESGRLLSKSSVSKGFKDEPVLPLTYKRRKTIDKANSLDFSKPLRTGADLNSATPKESNQHLGETTKAVKIKFTGWKDMPLNKES